MLHLSDAARRPHVSAFVDLAAEAGALRQDAGCGAGGTRRRGAKQQHCARQQSSSCERRHPCTAASRGPVRSHPRHDISRSHRLPVSIRNHRMPQIPSGILHFGTADSRAPERLYGPSELSYWLPTASRSAYYVLQPAAEDAVPSDHDLILSRRAGGAWRCICSYDQYRR